MKYLILIIACLLETGLCAQEQRVPEEVISFDVLKWHYAKYPNSQNNEWVAMVREGEQLFRVKFNFQNQDYHVEYDDRGVIRKEVLNLEDNLPVSIERELDEYEKYKVYGFLKINDKESERVVYRLDIKTKLDGHKTIWYDEDLIRMPNTDFTQSISDLY